MSANLPSLYGTQFATNVALLLQQRGSLLRPYVTEKGYVGEKASPVDQMGPVAMQPVASRFAPMGRVDAAVDRRWVFPSDFDLPQLIDSFDKLRLLADPQSEYVTNAVNAAGRTIDDVIIAAMHGTAQTGKDGTTATTLPTSTSTNVVSVSLGGTTSGLNVEKIKRGKRLLKANQVMPDDQIIMAVTAQDEESLLNELQVISSEFNGVRTLASGNVEQFLGVTFVQTERLLTGTDDAAGTSRSLPMWAKSGMHLGIWNDIRTDISQRNDLQGLPWQAYVYMTVGATRIEEKKMIRIWAR
jgi:hypothetical protein